MDLWDKAKTIASERGYSGDWSMVIDIYHYLGGTSKQVCAHVETPYPHTVKLVAIISSDEVLVEHRGNLSVYQRSVINLSRKSFKTQAVKQDLVDYDLPPLEVAQGFFLKGKGKQGSLKHIGTYTC